MTVRTPFQHFILTPYFVKVGKHPRDFGSAEAQTIWLDKRLQLFKNICLPSVTSQSNQNFNWILFFDIHAPKEQVDRVRLLIEPFPNISIVYTGSYDAEFAIKTVLSKIKPETEWIVTTRLDNDDAISANFVDLIHKNARFSEREFLNFPVGFLKFNENLYLYRHKSNAFTSCVEPVAGMISVICRPHPFLEEMGPVRQLPPIPAFLQVVHGGNISNKPRGMRVHRVLGQAGFESIQEMLVREENESDAEIIVENLTRAAVWSARDHLISVARRGAQHYLKTPLGRRFNTRFIRHIAGR